MACNHLSIVAMSSAQGNEVSEEFEAVTFGKTDYTLDHKAAKHKIAVRKPVQRTRNKTRGIHGRLIDQQSVVDYNDASHMNDYGASAPSSVLADNKKGSSSGTQSTSAAHANNGNNANGAGQSMINTKEIIPTNVHRTIEDHSNSDGADDCRSTLPGTDPETSSSVSTATTLVAPKSRRSGQVDIKKSRSCSVL